VNSGAGVTSGMGVDVAALAGESGSVTPEEGSGIKSDSEGMMMTFAACGLAAEGFLASTVLCPTGVGLVGEESSPCIGLEALQAVDRGASFCLFGVLSSTTSFSFSFSFLDSYGDLMGVAFPTGPFGVPRRVFSDL
jgi:hypothetical protein